jgi:hypothetical protein
VHHDTWHGGERGLRRPRTHVPASRPSAPELESGFMVIGSPCGSAGSGRARFPSASTPQMRTSGSRSTPFGQVGAGMGPRVTALVQSRLGPPRDGTPCLGAILARVPNRSSLVRRSVHLTAPSGADTRAMPPRFQCVRPFSWHRPGHNRFVVDYGMAGRCKRHDYERGARLRGPGRERFHPVPDCWNRRQLRRTPERS